MIRTVTIAHVELLRRGQLAVGLVVAFIAVVVAGCLPGPGDDTANGGLGGTSWTVVSVAGTATIADARPTMAFAADGTVSGSDGCNQYSGPFGTNGQEITVGQLTSTLIGCELQLGAQAQAFTQALAGATTWSRTETGALELHGHGDLIGEPSIDMPDGAGSSPGAVVDLVGTGWVLEELDGSTLVDTFPTITFGGDGSVTGSAGCNTFSGTYAVDGTSLGVGPLGTTKMACADPTMFVESAFLAALRGVTGWSVRPDGRLVLDGRHPLTFGPA